MRVSALLIPLLVACTSAPSTRQGDSPFKAYILSQERRLPPLAERAVLVVVTPTEYDARGLGAVMRVREARSGNEVEPVPEYQLVELRPGRHTAWVYYWVRRSRIQRTATGEPKLLMEDLRSIEPVPISFEAEAGKTYFIDPEVLVKPRLGKYVNERWHPVIYGKRTGYDPSPPPAEYEVTDDYLWRPRIAELEGEAAAQYRRYR